MVSRSSRESLPTLLFARSIGQKFPRSLWDRLHSQENMNLRDNVQIVSPHQKSISTLHMDRIEGRFLLAGSLDATLSIFDLTPWGRERPRDTHDCKEYHIPTSVHKPVAQSLRQSATGQAGHKASIVKAEWYAFDTGAFISASLDGALAVWDTESMQPVAQFHPFSLISTINLSKSSGPSESLVAVTSANDASLKLVDLRCGSTSHALTGHHRGVTTVQWCPTCDVVLASGSDDGTIRLWDIRKSGSRATITILDRETVSPLPLQSFYSDYRHLMRKHQRGPNVHDEAAGMRSHSGRVTGISFTSDGQFLVSCGGRQLQLWDLRSRGHLMTRHFDGVAQSPLLVVDCNVWMPHHNTDIGVYSLDLGGPPHQILEGHLGRVTALEYSFESMQLISGGADSMILVWGSQRRLAPVAATKGSGLTQRLKK